MARPPRLPDAAILDLIAELRSRHPVLTGTRLREELRLRHGTPFGVGRIYRLLKTSNQEPSILGGVTPSKPADDSNEAVNLRDQLRQALERATLAEHREEHHQARWAGEIHQLREQVHELKVAAHRLPLLEREVQDRSRELASAYLRIADLESELLQLRPPEDR